ncbi:hypothetical protein ACQR3P_28930 [Rhodococcus sp. IEGM1300]
MSTSIDFKEAIRLETAQLDIEQIMQDMLESMEAETQEDVKMRMSDMDIRRYMLAVSMIGEEADRMKTAKQAVVAQWDKMIAQQVDAQNRLKQLVEHEISLRKQEDSKFKNLKLDIGTLTMTASKKEIKLIDEKSLEMTAHMKGVHANYVVSEFDSKKMFADIKAQYKETGVVPPEYAIALKEEDKPGAMRFTSRIK